jgi:hypothetical protein
MTLPFWWIAGFGVISIASRIQPRHLHRSSARITHKKLLPLFLQIALAFYMELVISYLNFIEVLKMCRNEQLRTKIPVIV